MSKQDTLERMRRGEAVGYEASSGIVSIFEDHYRLAVKSMGPSHAAANAHDAVQRHLASLNESEEASRMP